MKEINTQNNLPVQYLNEIDIKSEIEIKQKYAETVKNILKENSILIDGKNYIKAQGWIALANLHGLQILTNNLEIKDDEYVVAECEIRDKYGNLISKQIGYAHKNETSKIRKTTALVGMAQTRAIARALKNVFAFIPAFLKEFEFTAYDEIDFDKENEQLENLENSETDVKQTKQLKIVNKDKEKDNNKRDTYLFLADILKNIREAKDIQSLNKIASDANNQSEFNLLNERQKELLRNTYMDKKKELEKK